MADGGWRTAAARVNSPNLSSVICHLSFRPLVHIKRAKAAPLQAPSAFGLITDSLITDYFPGGAVDPRTMSFGVNIFRWTPWRPRSRSNIRRIVYWPIFSTGWAIAVIGGSIYRIQKASSKVTIDKSSGTRIAASRTKVISPEHISKLATKTAVGGFGSLNSFLAHS